jgi:hypothetical protein
MNGLKNKKDYWGVAMLFVQGVACGFAAFLSITLYFSEPAIYSSLGIVSILLLGLMFWRFDNIEVYK